MDVEIAIVGAGMSGLTCAAALVESGRRDLAVFEAARQLEEIGAGIAIGGNATRALSALGVEAARFGHVPPALEFRRWSDGRLLSVHEIGHRYTALVGAPYLTFHRATLQHALVDKIRALDVPVMLGHRLERIEHADDEGPVELHFANGARVRARIAVGCDGIHSVARRFVAPDVRPRYSGEVGFRGVIPVERAPSFPCPHSLSIWCGPNTHIVAYAVDDGALVNLLAAHTPPELPAWTRETNRIPQTREACLARFASFGWAEPVLELIRAIEGDMHDWALMDLPPARSWSRGRVILAGDAIHAPLPHQGMGGGMGIESGYALGTLLGRLGAERWRDAFALFVRLRRPRTKAVQVWSRIAGRAYELADPEAVARRDRTFWRVADRIAWIHRYDIVSDVDRILGRLDVVREPLLERLARWLERRRGIDPGRVRPEATLEGLGLDSLDVAELALELEEEFDVAVAVRPETLVTVGDVLAVLRRAGA